MGATTFVTTAEGKDARSAFNSAVQAAQYERGHNGYTGTIAEKHSYVMIRDTIEDVMTRVKAHGCEYTTKWLQDAIDKAKPEAIACGIAEALMRLSDARVDSKYGPAGCIHVEGTRYVFFGWARE